MTDSTRCAHCGGQFSAKRVHIDGQQFHEICALMSYPSHTPEDAQAYNAEIYRLKSGLERIHESLMNPTMPRQSIGEMVYALLNP